MDPDPKRTPEDAHFDRKLMIEMLRRMLLIRAFETRLPTLSSQGLIRGSAHVSVGQEAVAVGACFALAPTDYMTSTHRGHGHTIAKGGDVKRMMAELLGRIDGYCRGKGGSMHIADFSIGMLGANGIVGGGIGIATGAALSATLRRSGQVTLCFFGEGAVNQGVLLECGNMAALWKLPVIYLCENNQFAMSSRPAETISVSDVSQRANGLGIQSVKVDGMDAIAVYQAVSEAACGAREGNGPSLIEAVCYRYQGHFAGDGLKYRSSEEFESWRARDPITKLRDHLIGSNALSASEAEELTQAVEGLVDGAVEFAKLSPAPDAQTAFEDLHAS
jgi:TPP-dependent pyruvate/acetoin dehydrogenase alpha subunit